MYKVYNSSNCNSEYRSDHNSLCTCMHATRLLSTAMAKEHNRYCFHCNATFNSTPPTSSVKLGWTTAHRSVVPSLTRHVLLLTARLYSVCMPFG